MKPGAWLSSRAGKPVMLRRFGWSFLLAWVFCVFYTQVVDGYVSDQAIVHPLEGLGVQLLFGGLPVFSSVIALTLIVCLENRLGAPVAHPRLFWLAPAATALSTPLFYLPTGDFAVTVGVFVAASLLTGFGSGFMWVMWGEYYAKITQEDAEFLAPVSAVVAAVLVLVVSSMSGWVAVAVVTLLPLASGACLAFSWRDVQGQEATAEHWGAFEQRAYNDARDRAQRNPFGALRAMGRGGLGVMVACLFVCVEGTFYEAPDKTSWPFQFVFVVSIAFMVVVAVASTMGPRRIAMSFLYRWMCPVLVVGFASVVLFGPDMGGYCAYVVSIAARFAFILITQLYFARFAATGKATAVQSFGFGWIFVHLGDFLGVVASVLLGEGVLQGALSLDQVAAGSMAVLVLVTMYVLNDEKSFSAETAAGMAQAGCGPDAFGPMGGAAALQRADGRDGAGSLSAGEEDGPQQSDALGERIQELAAQHALTPRETEVFGLLARGRSVPYIRDALVISKETAATHAKHVYAKLGVHSRQELIDLVH